MSLRALVAGSAVSLALISGCGGDGDSGGSSAEAWADEVCTSLSTWRNSMQSAGDRLKGGNLSKENVQGAARTIGTATQQLVGELKALDAPETESGEKAKQELDDLGDELQKGISQIQRASDDADTPQEARAAFSTIAATLATMANEFGSTFKALEDLDPAGDLEKAFNDADACDELTR